MKKILALLLVVIMAVSMCACGSTGTDEKPAAADNKTADTAKTQEEQTGTVKDTAILATSEEPYRFFAQSK